MQQGLPSSPKQQGGDGEHHRDVPSVISTTTPPRPPSRKVLPKSQQQQQQQDSLKDDQKEERSIPDSNNHRHEDEEDLSPVDINHVLSDLSDADVRPRSAATTTPPPQSPRPSSSSPSKSSINDGALGLKGSPINTKAIQNFFYPPRQQQQHRKPRVSSSVGSARHVKEEMFEDEHDEDEHEQDEGVTRTPQRMNGRRAATATSTTTRVRLGQPLPPLTIPSFRNDTTSPETDRTENRTRQQQQFGSPNLSSPSRSSIGGGGGSRDSVATIDTEFRLQEQRDNKFVENFWTIYDELLILSLFTQIGILCRLGAASFFSAFDGVFHSNSALFTNLPLNCLSCFVMGLLCSGENLMEIISTRFTPPRLQQDLHREAQSDWQEQQQRLLQFGQSPSGSSSWGDNDGMSDDDELEEMETATETEETTTARRSRLGRRKGMMARRRKKRQRWKRSRSSSLFNQQQQRNSDVKNDLREVQLLAWERRIRSSVCLLLFPVRQEDIDVVENYFSSPYSNGRRESEFDPNNSSTNGRADDRSFVDDDGRIDEIPLNDVEDDVGFDDLILQEEDENDHPKNVDVSSSHHHRRTSSAASVGSSSAVSSINEPVIVERHETTRMSTAADNVPSKNSTPPPLPQRHRSSVVPLVTDESNSTVGQQPRPSTRSSGSIGHAVSPVTPGVPHPHGVPHARWRQFQQVEGGQVVDYGTQDNPDLDQVIEHVATEVQKGISTLQRVNLANGWDVGTSPQEKSEDLMLGLRDGLCGALSSFSSWISSMVNLFKSGQIGQGFVGLVLGIQLPLVAYRFGQFISVYIFVWRCRREKKQSERRGYGLQIHADDEGSVDGFATRSHDSADSRDDVSASQWAGRTKGRKTVHDEESNVPSVRAIVTALCIMFIVAQLTALHFFYEPQDRLLALSLLFSPLGVLARWRMMKFNSWRPSFPIGTFACNITACALAGSLGTLLAGNPGPRERIALVAIIAGFGGTLSSVARFIVEIIAGMDPVLFRFDGVIYAVASVFAGVFVSFFFSASVDWADETQPSTDDVASDMPSFIPSMAPTLIPSMPPTT